MRLDSCRRSPETDNRPSSESSYSECLRLAIDTIDIGMRGIRRPWWISGLALMVLLDKLTVCIENVSH